MEKLCKSKAQSWTWFEAELWEPSTALYEPTSTDSVLRMDHESNNRSNTKPRTFSHNRSTSCRHLENLLLLTVPRNDIELFDLEKVLVKIRVRDLLTCAFRKSPPVLPPKIGEGLLGSSEGGVQGVESVLSAFPAAAARTTKLDGLCITRGVDVVSLTERQLPFFKVAAVCMPNWDKLDAITKRTNAKWTNRITEQTNTLIWRF